MTLKYSLNENDYLQSQLFIASKTERIKNQRTRSWILISLGFFSLSYLFSQTDKDFLVYYFIGLGILSIFLYPIYQKSYYRKHYQKYIADTLKNRFGELSTITFTDTNIECFDRTDDGKINLTEIEEIFEIMEYFFLRMKSGVSLIIPKSKIENTDNLRTELKTLADKLKVNYTSELNWKWK